MNRFLKVVSSLALVAFLASCKKDDDSVNIAPPRDYAVQYASEKDSIEKYLKTHYIANVDADFNVDIQEIPAGNTSLVSLWDDQGPYKLKNKEVSSNGVNYMVYYVLLREGVGESPSKYDRVLTAYRGTLLDGTQFDYNPYPQHPSSLLSTIEAWQEIIPLFKAGTSTDIPGNPNPATFENYGAGIMFVPSGLAYYNSILPDVPSYSSMVFSFKLYAVEREDHDGDGILTINETAQNQAGELIDPMDYDTDADGTPNFLDTDDDNDGYTTKAELQSGIDCDNDNATPTTIHLDPNCHP